MRYWIFAFSLVVTAELAVAQDSYDQILTQAYQADGPGAAALVVKQGEVLYRGATG